jgi:hypothetical protein
MSRVSVIKEHEELEFLECLVPKTQAAIKPINN